MKNCYTFYQLLRKESYIVLTEKHHKSITTLRKDLEQACQVSLQLPKLNTHVISSNASFYAAGYVLLIEDDQTGKTHKTCVPVAFGSKIFTPTYLKMSIHAKYF